MLFKAFINEHRYVGSTSQGKYNTYVPRDRWWLNRKLCIDHLEETHHTVKVKQDGTVLLTGDLNLIDCGIPSIELVFSEIQGNAKLQGNKLTNFDWADKLIVKGNLDIGDNLFTSLSGINKRIKFVGRHINVGGNPLKGGILSLMLFQFQNLEYGNRWGIGNDADLGEDAKKAFKIIEKHRLRSRVDSERIIDAQHELIEAGLDAYAEL